MDVVFLLDNTGSFSGDDRDRIRAQLRALIEGTALPTSGGDLRLGFISFGDGVDVHEQLITDVQHVLSEVDAVLSGEPDTGGGPTSLPEPSDQALAEMLGWPRCLDHCRPDVFGEVPFRGECIKHAILITDDPPAGCNDHFDDPQDRDNADARAVEAAAAGWACRL
jgi:hypothetical protein